MRITLSFFFIFCYLAGAAQDFLSVPASQPNQFERLIPSKDKTELIDSLIYLFNPRDIPFRDDFSRNQLTKLNAKPTDPGVFDTTFYKLFIGNQLSDTANRFTNFPTNIYRFNSDSTAIDTTNLPSVQLTVNDYSVYPIRSETVTAYPAYNIYDTVGKPLDTITSSFLYEQDSIVRYVVLPKGNTLWQNDYVLINNDYAWNPPTYGVATFDGLNREGRAYNNTSINTYGITDYLTSVPFNIGYLQESDSVFLSFYYQPQGLGRDAPESEDSLVVEFYDPNDSRWALAWGARGTARTPFQLQLIKLTDRYLQDGFQFRFRSKGNRSGAYDTWNVDYIYLDKGRNSVDTTVNDIAIGQTYTSMIKEYTSIPFWQYGALSSALMRDTVSMLILNNNNSSRTVFFRYFISDPQGIFYPNYPFPTSLNTSTSIAGLGFQQRELPLLDAPVNFEYPVSDMDTAHTFITTFIARGNNTSNDDYPLNDTLFHEQRFDHYLAYDNGSAEAGYGVNITDTTFGKRAMVAQEFRTLIPNDTLNAISIYFLPQGLDMEGQKFNLCVWKDLSPTGLIYKKQAVDQVYYSSKNGFLTYLLDTSIEVSGTFYVGFEQNGVRSLNVGYDFKNNQKDKLFYSLNSGVNFIPTSAAIQPGTAMIRPYFKVDSTQVSISKNKVQSIDFNVYPNPTKGIINLDINGVNINSQLSLQLYDISGRLLINKVIYTASAQIDLSTIKDGIYLLRATDSNGFVATKRIIVSH